MWTVIIGALALIHLSIDRFKDAALKPREVTEHEDLHGHPTPVEHVVIGKIRNARTSRNLADSHANKKCTSGCAAKPPPDQPFHMPDLQHKPLVVKGVQCGRDPLRSIETVDGLATRPRSAHRMSANWRDVSGPEASRRHRSTNREDWPLGALWRAA